jgi:hypothetical protein
MPIRELPDGSFMHDDPNEATITELFAFLSIDETGEGICAAMIGSMATPLVTSKFRIADTIFRAMARDIEKGSGKKVILARFVRVDRGEPT